MKFFLAMSALLGTAMALPQFNNNRGFNRQSNNQFNSNQGFGGPAKQVVPILQYSNDLSIDGSYQYSYQTGDGINANANGVLKNLGGRDAENSVAQVVQGSYSYTAPDGQVITVNYIADENGYRAESAAIPTPPPIPAEIARSLQLLESTQSQAPVVGFRQSNSNSNSFNSFSQRPNRFSG